MESHPPFIAPTAFNDAAAALARAQEIYQVGLAHLRTQLQSFMALPKPPAAALAHVRACYPFVRLRTMHTTHPDTRLAYGFVAHAGNYETTLTRPDLFADYYLEQFGLLLASHDAPLEVGISNQPIPLPFSFGDGEYFDGGLAPWQRAMLGEVFDLPDLMAMDDRIANGTQLPRAGEPLQPGPREDETERDEERVAQDGDDDRDGPVGHGRPVRSRGASARG